MEKREEVGEPSREATFLQIQKYYTETEYFKRFRERLREEIVKYYNEDMANDIFNYLDEGKLEIVNPELFFHKKHREIDPSDKWINKAQDISQYFRELPLTINAILGEGGLRINLIGFLVAVARMMEVVKEDSGELPSLQALMDSFIVAIAKVRETRSPKIEILVLDELLLREYVKDNEFPTENYYLAYKMLLNSCQRVRRSMYSTSLKLPHIRFVRAIFSKGGRKRIDKLHELLGLDKAFIKEALANISIYDYSSEELNTVLDYLIAKSGKLVDKEALLKYLEDLVDAPVYSASVYINSSTYKSIYNSAKIDAISEKKMYVSNYYINLETFRDFIEPAVSEVRIFTHKNQKVNEEIDRLLDCANAINMVRMRKLFQNSFKAVSRISIHNLHLSNTYIMSKIAERKKVLASSYGRYVAIPVFYNYKAINKLEKTQVTKYLRIISDIHADINEEKDYKFSFLDDFVVCCGDISGNAKTSTKWIKNNMSKGVFVHGNHLGYSTMDGSLNYTYEEEDTLNNQIKYLKENFNGNNPVRYLNNSCYEYDGLVFIGTCLYTDFSLYGENRVSKSMNYCEQKMNDFVYPKIKDKGVIRKITAQDHVRMNMKATKFLWEAVSRNAGSPMIIVTHHAPLPFSISNEYIGNPLNSSFVHNMKELIDKFPNIRIWAHGHVHSKFDYIYNNTRVICRPFGYFNETNMNMKSYSAQGERINISKVKDEEAWKKVLHNRIVVNKYAKKYTEEDMNDFI